MCQPATCRTCANVTWSGCGQHVEQVMRAVPADRRCRCTGDDRAPAGMFSSLLSKVLGRR